MNATPTSRSRRVPGPLAKRFHYLRRVFGAYLGRQQSQLTFWHEQPSPNPGFTPNDLGEYYMPFEQKADYPGHYDPAGIPMLDYHGVIGLQYNPIAIAQYALGNYNLYRRTGSAERRQKFLLIAKWLVANLQPNANGLHVWMHHFDWDYRNTLRAPWYSGLAQGQGISVLVRAFKETGDEVYLGAASRALQAFTHTVNDGGVIFKDEAGYIWFEEYIVHPNPPTHILNGFIWAAWGIYDYWLATKDSHAKQLWDDAVRTLTDRLPEFDAGFWSLYEQSGTRMKMLASPFYHKLHIAQLTVMHRLTSEPVFAGYAARWERYRRNLFKRSFALTYKSVFKVFYY